GAGILFAASAPGVGGIEAIGPIQWFLNLLEELGIDYQVGDAAKIRAAEPRKQEHDRRDAELILKRWWVGSTEAMKRHRAEQKGEHIPRPSSRLQCKGMGVS